MVPVTELCSESGGVADWQLHGVGMFGVPCGDCFHSGPVFAVLDPLEYIADAAHIGRLRAIHHHLGASGSVWNRRNPFKGGIDTQVHKFTDLLHF